MSDRRVAVVTGAGQGIGAAIAEALAGRGDIVILASRSRDRLESVGARISASGGQCEVKTLDLSDPAAISTFGADVVAEWGVPQILVNAAGNAINKPALEVTPVEWDLIHDVHLRGTFFMCQALGGPMGDAGYGKIINLSSTWASTAKPGRSVYAAAKAGVSHLTSALAVEWAPRGVRVNAIAPTTTMTPRVAIRVEQDPDLERAIGEQIPLGRMATVEDVTNAAVFLASPESDFITGHTLYVDGGFQHAK